MDGPKEDAGEVTGHLMYAFERHEVCFEVCHLVVVKQLILLYLPVSRTALCVALS